MSHSFTERCTVVITWADLYQGLFPAGWSSTHSAPCKAPSPTGVGRGDMAATALTHGTEVSDLPTAARLCALEPWLCPSALPHWHMALQHSPGCPWSNRRHADSQSWTLAAALASPRLSGDTGSQAPAQPNPTLLPRTPQANKVSRRLVCTLPCPRRTVALERGA